MEKQALEKRIVEARSKLQLSDTDFSWLSSREWTEVLEAFSRLHAYYLKSDQETQHIYFEVLNAYLDITRFLNLVLRQRKYPEHEEQLQDALDGFEYMMDGLINAGYRQINNP